MVRDDIQSLDSVNEGNDAADLRFPPQTSARTLRSFYTLNTAQQAQVLHRESLHSPTEAQRMSKRKGKQLHEKVSAPL